jgi:hypothetical protein
MGLFDEKTQGQKFHDTVPLSEFVSLLLGDSKHGFI